MNTKQDKTKYTKICMYDIRSDYLSVVSWLSKFGVDKIHIKGIIEKSVTLMRTVYNSNYDKVKDIFNPAEFELVTLRCCEKIAIFNDDFKMFNIFYDDEVWGNREQKEINQLIRAAIDGDATNMLKWLLNNFTLEYITLEQIFYLSLEHGGIEALTIVFDNLVGYVSEYSISRMLQPIYINQFKYGKTELLDYIINHRRFNILTVITFFNRVYTRNIDVPGFLKYIILNSKLDPFYILTSITRCRIFKSQNLIKQLVMDVYWETSGKYLYVGKFVPKDIVTNISQLCVSRLLQI